MQTQGYQREDEKGNQAMTTKADTSIKIRFNFQTLKWENLCADQVEAWENLYPDISVRDELLDMVRWLEKNKDKKSAHKRAWKSFICKWLRKSQMMAVLS